MSLAGRAPAVVRSRLAGPYHRMPPALPGMGLATSKSRRARGLHRPVNECASYDATEGRFG
jgi:hypothetical protein